MVVAGAAAGVVTAVGAVIVVPIGAVTGAGVLSHFGAAGAAAFSLHWQ